MNDEKNNVIKRLQELCQENNLSLYRLAKMTGIPVTTMQNTIRENRMPSLPTIEKICNGLDITLAEFFSSENYFSVLTQTQQEVISLYDSLSIKKKRLAVMYLQMLEDIPEEEL